VCWAVSRRLHGFSIIKLIKYIKEELFLVLGTSSSESALPRLMAKMENAGAQKSVVGLVVPTGYQQPIVIKFSHVVAGRYAEGQGGRVLCQEAAELS
jgi:hypothetical protein